MMQREIIVLMSTYNGERYIEEQIDSILNQDNCRVRILVRDDGSSDRTLEILENYRRESKLEYFAGDNLGPAKSFLTLIKQAPVADFYAFADQDDRWLPNKLYRATGLLSKYEDKPALYSSNMKRADQNMNLISEYALPHKVATDFESVMTVSGRLFGCTMVFNRNLANIIKEHELPEKMVMHDLWLAMIASLYNSLIYDDEPYIMYRTHSSSVTFSKNISLLKKIRSMFFGSKDCFSKECENFCGYIGKETIEELGHWEICDVLVNYKKSLKKKVRLQFIMMRKSDMSLKLRIHHIVQIAFGKY